MRGASRRAASARRGTPLPLSIPYFVVAERRSEQCPRHPIRVGWHVVRTLRARLPRAGSLGADAWRPFMVMGDPQRDAERPARIARRRLDPDLVERSFPLDTAVADAVQCHAAGHAQVFQARQLVCGARHAQHDFLGDILNRSGEIQLALRQRRFRLARRSFEQPLESAAGHRQAVHEFEVLEVQPNAAIVVDVDDVIADGRDVARFAVRREPHHLVLARVDAEAGEVRERGIQQADRMRKALLLQHLHRRSPPDADRGCRPFADAVHRGSPRPRTAGIKAGPHATRGDRQTAAGCCARLAADTVGEPQLARQPLRHRHQVRVEPRARPRVGFERSELTSGFS